MYKHFIKGSKDVTPDQLKCSGIVFDPGLPEPLYLQLADALHERIQCHTGEKCALPSVRTLAAELKIDRSTASKAYAELERRGITYSVPGRGSFVSPELDVVTEEHKNRIIREAHALLEEARATGMRADFLPLIGHVWEKGGKP